MVTWLIVVGIVLLVSAGFFIWAWRGERQNVALMQATETTRAADLGKLPTGSQVEVKGTLRCATPVTGEFSECPCAYFVAIVERDYQRWDYEPQHQRSRRVRGTETVQSKTLFAPFEVEDESGRVKVVAEQATVEGVVAVDRFEPYQETHEAEGLAKAAMRALTTNEETLGFRYKEVHLPLDAAIYVLGVKAADGSIAAPMESDKGQSFIISTKSEEARVAKLQSSAKWTLRLGLACAIAGLACLAGAYALTRPQGAPAAAPQETGTPSQTP